MLEVKNLMIFFENAVALNDFSMEVQEKQVVGIIGSNSAGKTSLMNALSGLIIDMRTKEKEKAENGLPYTGRSSTREKRSPIPGPAPG